MKNFIALYYNTSGAHQAPPELTAEQKEQMLAPWNAWEKKYGDRIVDLGSPATPATVSKNGDAWSSSKNFVTGYSIVAAESMADAQEMFKGHPMFYYPDHTVEISECVSV